MHACEWCIADVIRRVIVLDGAVEPLTAIRAEDLARLHGHVRRNVRVPPVVADVLLIDELLAVVQREQILRHIKTSHSLVA